MKKKNLLIISIVAVLYIFCCLLFQVVCIFNTDACEMKLKAIASHIPDYSRGNNGLNPPSLSILLGGDGYLTQAHLHCPSDEGNEDSYLYSAEGLGNIEPYGTIIICEKNANHKYDVNATLFEKIIYFFTFNARCPRIRHVVFNDLTVRPITEPDIDKAIVDSKTRHSLGLRENPID